MMKKNKFNTKKDERSNSPFEQKKKFCPFSQPGSPEIDYKDIRLLSRYLTEKGKIEAKKAGNLIKDQNIKIKYYYSSLQLRAHHTLKLIQKII